MRIRILSAVAAGVLLAACSGSSAKGPDGWQPVPGASPGSEWSTDTGAATQTYTYASRDFAGTLQELASQQAASMVSATKGAHLDGSDVVPACPGQAALATYSVGRQRIVMQGMAVQNGKAVLVTYIRPLDTAMGPAVAKAFEKALCVS